ncbi:hypothetical protein EVAR_11629_1 [Eumeta japonica]|uniref:Uncharacterized protein n=1 Tax=Eumeta variegata TaxID=151549 RepID=A0A4C1WXP3_EUMVA|nr:hypothetical protein EVAR_11629_1 [Eumeta japonica]
METRAATDLSGRVFGENNTIAKEAFSSPRIQSRAWSGSKSGRVPGPDLKAGRPCRIRDEGTHSMSTQAKTRAES